MNSPATIQLASTADAPAIARLSRDLIEQGLGWRWTAARVRRSLFDAATNVAVVRGDDGGVAGFGLMRYDDDEAHLLLLAVASAQQGRGLGMALVTWLELPARVAGLKRVWLEARDGNLGAVRFYRRLGYREFARVPGYYEGREGCVRMGRDLEP